MSRSLRRGGFSHSDATALTPNRKLTSMIRNTDPMSEDLKRIPGLYRRWELPEILKNHRTYGIEKAGTHQDGTPLVAIYADGANNETASPDDTDPPIVLPGTSSSGRG